MKNIRMNWLADEPYALCLAYCKPLKMGVIIKDLQMEGCISSTPKSKSKSQAANIFFSWWIFFST